MRAFLVCFSMTLMAAVLGVQPDADRVKKLFNGDNYTVTRGTPPAYESDAVLEIGQGNGHGGTLGWLRFQPNGRAEVEVLIVRLDEGREQYKSKWPPDRAPVVVKRARMKPDAYAAI